MPCADDLPGAASRGRRCALLRASSPRDVRAGVAGRTAAFSRAAHAGRPKGQLRRASGRGLSPGLSSRELGCRLLLPRGPGLRETVLAHLKKYAVFQKVSIEDRSDDFARIGTRRRRALRRCEPPTGSVRLCRRRRVLGDDLLVPAAARDELLRGPRRRGRPRLSARGGRGPSRRGGPAPVRPGRRRDRTSRTKSGSTTRSRPRRAATSARRSSRGCAPTGASTGASSASGFPTAPIAAGTRSSSVPASAGPGRDRSRAGSRAPSCRRAFGAIGLGWAFRDVPAAATASSSAEDAAAPAPSSPGFPFRVSARVRADGGGRRSRAPGPRRLGGARRAPRRRRPDSRSSRSSGRSPWPSIPPLALAAIRVVCAAAPARGRPPGRAATGSSSRGDRPAVFLYALLGVSFNQMLFILGPLDDDRDQHDRS